MYLSLCATVKINKCWYLVLYSITFFKSFQTKKTTTSRKEHKLFLNVYVLLFKKKRTESKSSIIVITHNDVYIFDFGTTHTHTHKSHFDNFVCIFAFVCVMCLSLWVCVVLYFNAITHYYCCWTCQLPYHQWWVIFIFRVGTQNLFFFSKIIITDLFSLSIDRSIQLQFLLTKTVTQSHLKWFILLGDFMVWNKSVFVVVVLVVVIVAASSVSYDRAYCMKLICT